MLRVLALGAGLVVIPAVASAQQPCTTSDARHVVNLIYSQVLERPADRGSDAHVRRLTNGTATVRDVVAAVAKSSEHVERYLSGGNPEAAVRALYVHILGREPDAPGLTSNMEALQNQGAGAVIDFMLSSPEYQAKYGLNGVPGSPGVRYCQERAIGTAGDIGDVREMDRNGDGVITAAEWRGTPQSFRTHDWNNDNVLSGDELRPGSRGAPAGIAGRDANDTPAGAPAEFDTIDYNRDGRITEAEWHYGYEAFNRVDRNGDRVISRPEFSAGAGTTTGR